MTDEQLMHAVKQGELQLAARLFEAYHRPLYHFLAKLAYDREVAQDLTQNVFVRLIRFRHTYQEEMKFSSWIYQIARNVFADHYRSMKVLKNDHVDVHDISDSLVDQQEVSKQVEQDELLNQSLGRLSTEDREILVLSKFQKLKYQEIAVIIDSTIPAVKVKVHRAIKRLRQHYFELEQSE